MVIIFVCFLETKRWQRFLWKLSCEFHSVLKSRVQKVYAAWSWTLDMKHRIPVDPRKFFNTTNVPFRTRLLFSPLCPAFSLCPLRLSWTCNSLKFASAATVRLQSKNQYFFYSQSVKGFNNDSVWAGDKNQMVSSDFTQLIILLNWSPE